MSVNGKVKVALRHLIGPFDSAERFWEESMTERQRELMVKYGYPIPVVHTGTRPERDEGSRPVRKRPSGSKVRKRKAYKTARP